MQIRGRESFFFFSYGHEGKKRGGQKAAGKLRESPPARTAAKYDDDDDDEDDEDDCDGWHTHNPRGERRGRILKTGRKGKEGVRKRLLRRELLGRRAS